jgi:hypothetical protein
MGSGGGGVRRIGYCCCCRRDFFGTRRRWEGTARGAKGDAEMEAPGVAAVNRMVGIVEWGGVAWGPGDGDRDRNALSIVKASISR